VSDKPVIAELKGMAKYPNVQEYGIKLSAYTVKVLMSEIDALEAFVTDLEAQNAKLKRQLEACNSIIKELAVERAVLLCKVKGIAPEGKE